MVQQGLGLRDVSLRTWVGSGLGKWLRKYLGRERSHKRFESTVAVALGNGSGRTWAGRGHMEKFGLTSSLGWKMAQEGLGLAGVSVRTWVGRCLRKDLGRELSHKGFSSDASERIWVGLGPADVSERICLEIFQ